MISLKNISFSYVKDKEVLKDVSFDILDGECVILLGPNGVGKSTLISLVLGNNKLQKGTISFNEIDSSKLTPKLKADYLSYVPQLIDGTDLTVWDTILLGRLPYYKIYPTKKDKELIDSYIKNFSLEEIKDKQTNQISGGERQKVSILRGFIQDSKVIIFDEPTSNLDIKAQLDVINLIKNEKNKNNKSFLVSMHDINQALAIGDKFVFLKDGRVHKICSKDDIDEKIIQEVYGVTAKIIINDKGGKHIIYED